MIPNRGEKDWRGWYGGFWGRFKRAKRLAFAGALLAVVAIILVLSQFYPVLIRWPDRRPIGVLFLASHFHSSAANPRGWFNDPAMDFVGTNGMARFRTALMAYADRSIVVLKQTGAQGVIVWDLEGEQYPHKITFVGDPRMISPLAPEMAGVVDEFFARFREAGFRVGVTIRPQQLILDAPGGPRQRATINVRKCLAEKIDFARSRWGATLFYIDSNGGIRRPDEAWQLRCLAAEHPDVLLIPEHSTFAYASFAAPYVDLRQGEGTFLWSWVRQLMPRSFRAVNIADSSARTDELAALREQGDILLFRAWFWNQDCERLTNTAGIFPKQFGGPEQIH